MTKFVDNPTKFTAAIQYKNGQTNIIDFPKEWVGWSENKIYDYLRDELTKQNVMPENVEVSYSILIREL